MSTQRIGKLAREREDKVLCAKSNRDQMIKGFSDKPFHCSTLASKSRNNLTAPCVSCSNVLSLSSNILLARQGLRTPRLNFGVLDFRIDILADFRSPVCGSSVEAFSFHHVPFLGPFLALLTFSVVLSWF